MKSTLTIVRWLAFLPVALATMLLTDVLLSILPFHFGPQWLWSTSQGGMVGAAYLVAGLKIAPRRTAAVTLALASLLFLLCSLSVAGLLLGGAVSGNDELQIAKLFRGIGAGLISVAGVTSPKFWAEHVTKTVQ